jgi:hypothetical protein
MFAADLVPSLCAKLIAEDDPDRLHQLAEILRSVIAGDIEDIRIRGWLLAKHFPEITNHAA